MKPSAEAKKTPQQRAKEHAAHLKDNRQTMKDIRAGKHGQGGKK